MRLQPGTYISPLFSGFFSKMLHIRRVPVASQLKLLCRRGSHFPQRVNGKINGPVQALKHRFLSSSIAKEVVSRPPILVRSMLVGASVGLATPAFVIAGVFQAWVRVMPRSSLGSATKAVVGVLIGGGSLQLVYNYVGPFLRDHSEVVLPFALSNAIASSFWYTVGELSIGLDAMMATGIISASSAKAVDGFLGQRLLAIATKPPLQAQQWAC